MTKLGVSNTLEVELNDQKRSIYELQEEIYSLKKRIDTLEEDNKQLFFFS